MPFKIDQFLDSATSDPQLRQRIISVHDDLHAAHKIVESVASTIGEEAHTSDQILIAVFNELRKLPVL